MIQEQNIGVESETNYEDINNVLRPEDVYGGCEKYELEINIRSVFI